MSIITIGVIDKGKTTGLVCTTITTQMNTIDSAEFLEKLRKIFLGCSGRNVRNSDCWNLKFIKITNVKRKLNVPHRFGICFHLHQHDFLEQHICQPMYEEKLLVDRAKIMFENHNFYSKSCNCHSDS